MSKIVAMTEYGGKIMVACEDAIYELKDGDLELIITSPDLKEMDLGEEYSINYKKISSVSGEPK